MSYINNTYTENPTPGGLEKAAERICTRLKSLPWMEATFGLCHLLSDSEGKREPYRHLGKSDYRKLGDMDTLKSYAYVLIDGPSTWNGGEWEQPVRLIVWVDLNKIDKTKDYNYLEALSDEVERKLTGYDISAKGTTPSYVFDRDLKWPFGGIRFDLTLTYQKPC